MAQQCQYRTLWGHFRPNFGPANCFWPIEIAEKDGALVVRAAVAPRWELERVPPPEQADSVFHAMLVHRTIVAVACQLVRRPARVVIATGSTAAVEAIALRHLPAAALELLQRHNVWWVVWEPWGSKPDPATETAR